MRTLVSQGLAVVQRGRAYVLQFGWMLAERVWMMVSGVVIGFWVVRSLGPEEFGKFSVALAVTAVLGGLATVGIDTVVVRRLSSGGHDTRAVLITAASLRLAGSFCYVLLCWIASLLLFPDSTEVAAIAFILAASALFRVTEVTGLWLQAEQRFGRAACARIVVRVAGDIVRVGLILSGSGVIWFAVGVLVESAVAFVLFVALGWKFWKRPGLPDRANARSMFADGRPVMISGLIAALYARTDQLVLFNLAGPEQNGFYAAAVRISEAFVVLLLSVSAVAAAHFGRLSSAPDAQVQRDLQRFYRNMVVAGFAVSGLISLAAGPIVHAVYGPHFEPTVPILRVHAWTFALVAASVGLEPWFYHHGRLAQYVTKTLVTLIVCVPTVIGATHFFGPVGTAGAVVATYAVSVFATNILLPGARDAFRFQVRAFQRR